MEVGIITDWLKKKALNEEEVTKFLVLFGILGSEFIGSERCKILSGGGLKLKTEGLLDISLLESSKAVFYFAEYLYEAQSEWDGVPIKREGDHGN